MKTENELAAIPNFGKKSIEEVKETLAAHGLNLRGDNGAEQPPMRHQRAGKKLGRDSAHRKALYANLACSLIEHGRIKTTEAKAKAVKPLAEQMITLGRRGDLAARRQAISTLRSQDVVHQLFADVAPRFADRPGGYTRIVKLGPRQGDAADDGLPRARRLRARAERRRPDPARVERMLDPGGADRWRWPSRGGDWATHAPLPVRADRGGGRTGVGARDRSSSAVIVGTAAARRESTSTAGSEHLAERAGPSRGRESCLRDGRARTAVRPRRLRCRAQRVRARRRRLANAADARRRVPPPERPRFAESSTSSAASATAATLARCSRTTRAATLADAPRPEAATAPRRHRDARADLRDRRSRRRAWRRTSRSSSRGRPARSGGGARRRCRRRAAARARRRR